MKTKIFLLQSLLPICLMACSKDHSVDTATVRTVIVYMAADNDLWADALVDVEEMQAGFSEQRVNLVVFLDPSGEPPCLLKIAHGTKTTVKTYPEHNSADASQMRKVLDDAIVLYPARSYGLALWSHGTSWLPANHLLKSFGEDGGKQMNIPELAAALPVHFDFILFDACLMGSVEVAYELKDKTDYLIASSTETIYEGFPYDEIVPELLKSNIDMIRIAQTYFDYYNRLPGAYRSATISVTSTKELAHLAEVTKQLLTGASCNLSLFDRTAVQRLDIYSEQYAFDFFDFISKIAPEADKSLLTQQLNKTVLYKANTAQFLEEYNIETYCGLSCYIPHPNRSDLSSYYKTLKWYAASGFNLLF